MEHLHKTVDTRELMKAYRELLPKVDTLPLEITGSSMTPFLVPGRDTVHLSSVRRPLRKGDIVLYQRDSGAYILHRICGVHADCYDLIGDAHTVIEHGIHRDQIFSMVQWAERKGKKQAPGSFWWGFFSTLWIRMIPLRPTLLRCYHAIQKLFRR